MSDVHHIPLNKLIVSPANVRRTDRKADIDMLAASIAARGLLQNLTVTPTDDDRFEVVAGARRLAALKVLAKQGDLPKTCAIACQIVDRDSAADGIRPRKSNQIEWAKPMMTKSIASVPIEISRIGRRPKRSDSLPRIGAERKFMIA